MQKKTKKIISILFISLAVVAGGLAVLATMAINAFQEMGDCASSPQELLRYVTFSEPPEYVRNIEGGGYCWQDTALWLKLQTDNRFLEDLQSFGFKSSDWTNVERFMSLPADMADKFSTPWEPERISNKICFELNLEDQSKQVKFGAAVFDAEAGVLYIHAFDV